MSKTTQLQAGLDGRGQTTLAATLALAHNHQELQEILRMARATGVQLTLPAITAAVESTQSVVQVAHAADVTNFITITDVVPGVPAASGLLTIAIAPAGGDTLAVTMSAGGVLAIALANTTNSKNTLTLIKAALDVAGTGRIATKITGAGSTQMDGTTAAETYVAAAPGAAAGTGIKSSVAGTALVAASRTLAIATI